MSKGRATTLLAVSATLIISGLFCGQAAAETLNLAISPLTGKAKVGTRSFELTDRSRPAGLDQPGLRRLMVQVTYPRRRKAGPCTKAEYLPAAAQAKLMTIFALRDRVSANTRTCKGGTVKRKPLPLIVFSHAYTADRAVYTSLIADLASRGFLVAAVDHTLDAFTVEFPDGKLADGLFGSPLNSKPIAEAELADLIEMRTADIRFVTSWLLRQNRSGRSWLHRRIDRGRIGVFGHSLGGATAERVALTDSRFRASADVDGSLFGDWPLTGRTDKPFLLFVAEEGLGPYISQDKVCPWYGNATGPKLAWQLDGAKHLTFSDIQTLAPQIAAAKPSWPYATLYPMITGNLDPAASVRSQRDALARFFRTYLAPAGAPGSEPAAPIPPTGVTPVSETRLDCSISPG